MTIIRIESSNPEYARPSTLTLTINSTHLGRRQDVTVYNPYSLSKNLPVVILLHGVYGNNWVWMDLGGAHIVYEKLRLQGLSEFVLVMPSDGGIWEGSGYLPLQDKGDFEQWIIEDVIGAVKTKVEAVTDNSRMYISGLSMGGYGALRLGSKYAEMFSGISAHSAITQISDFSMFTETPISNYQSHSKYETDIVFWCEVNREVLPPMRFDCGNKDELLDSNKNLSMALTSAHVQHQFDVYDGGHEWPYWHHYLTETLVFFDLIEKNK